MPLLPTTYCPCKITAFPSPLLLPWFPTWMNCILQKKKTSTNRSPFTWNASPPQRRRDRQTDGRNNRDCKPWLSILFSKCRMHTGPATPPSELACCCCTNIESRKWNNRFSRRDSAQLPKREEQGAEPAELLYPYMVSWKRLLLRQVPLYTHTHPHSLTHRAEEEKN